MLSAVLEEPDEEEEESPELSGSEEELGGAVGAGVGEEDGEEEGISISGMETDSRSTVKRSVNTDGEKAPVEVGWIQRMSVRES